MTALHFLILLDGWGYRDQSQDNAMALGNTPTWEHILKNRSRRLISASGNAVSLTKGQISSSGVGRMNLCTGRVKDQNLTLINKALEDESLGRNLVCIGPKKVHLTYDSLKDTGSTLLDLMGITKSKEMTGKSPLEGYNQ